MTWELALLLLIVLATGVVMLGLFIMAKKLLMDPRRADRFDNTSDTSQ